MFRVHIYLLHRRCSLTQLFRNSCEMTGVTLVPAQLASVIIESLLLGICLVLSSVAIHVLVFKRGLTQASRTSTPRSNRVWLAVAVTLTCAAFAVRNLPSDDSRMIPTSSFYQHWIVNVCRVFDAFVYKAEDPGPLLVIANVADTNQVLKNSIYVFQATLADCVLVSFLEMTD